MADHIELVCINEEYNGNGIVSFDKQEKSIPGILKNEKGFFTCEKKGIYKNLTLVKITQPANYRIKPLCQWHLQCGGCQYQHITYERELELKQQYIESFFKTSTNVSVLPIIKMDDPYYYRNKCQMTYKLSKKKQVVCGFYEEGTHKIVPVLDCKIQSPKATEIIQKLNTILTKNKILPYDEKTNTGVIRHVLVKHGFTTNEIMLVIVTNGEMFPGRKNVLNDLLKERLGITTVIQNYNNRDTSIVLGDKERILYGPGFIYDEIEGYKFKISARSFYQINPKGMSLLYNNVISALKIKPTDVVLDTYCGVGTISILVSKFAKSVTGVELNKEAYNDALENAKINKIKNIHFINQDSTKFVKDLATKNTKVDLLILDPPRDGSTKDFINSVGQLAPKRVVYVSCEPKTLARDLYDFTKNGYIIKSVQGVDMFSRTFNLECVVVLELR